MERTVSYRYCKSVATTLRIMQYAVSLCKLFPCCIVGIQWPISKIRFPPFQDEIWHTTFYREIRFTRTSIVFQKQLSSIYMKG